MKSLPTFSAAFLYALTVTSPVYSASDSTAAPLTKAEFDAVIGEIRAMIQTDESAVSAFVVREATTERIERLYQMPELLTLSTTERENGLIFAGHGALLTFDKPSEILHKVWRWFPQEFVTARAENRNSFFGHIDLWGPYPFWDDEQIAFMTLWNCMPQIAWMSPEDNPFMRRLNDGGLTLMPIAARNSGELDFGFCVNQRSGLRPAWTEEQIPVVKQEVRDMAARATPVLQRKFAEHLNKQRCSGSGPDDCVLNLLLWASLTPDDPQLAASLLSLEAMVEPDGPLPALQQPRDQYEAGAQEGEAHFDAGLRKAAFLRAKLLSLLNAPQAWPATALDTSIAQLTRLQQNLNASIDYRWRYYALDYANEGINPWTVFARPEAQTDATQNAVLDMLNGLGRYTPCTIYEQWFKHAGAYLQTAHVLQSIQRNQPLRCASPDWTWLQQDGSPRAQALLTGFLSLPGTLGNGALHDTILDGLTDNGESCFRTDGTAIPEGIKALCATWINEPHSVETVLPNSRLMLDAAAQFTGTELPLPDATQPDWLLQLVQDADSRLSTQLQHIGALLLQRGVTVHAAKRWQHPDHQSQLYELQLNQHDNVMQSDWRFNRARLLLLVTPDSARLVGIPPRFGFQYDEGEIKYVSDLDADGNLEVWLAGTFGECDGEDLRPGIDCAIESLQMGEIYADALSYFSKTPGQHYAPLALGTALGLAVMAFGWGLRRRPGNTPSAHVLE